MKNTGKLPHLEQCGKKPERKRKICQWRTAERQDGDVRSAVVSAKEKSTGLKTGHHGRLGGVGGDYPEVGNIVSLLERGNSVDV